jgi:hypothetical protein
MFQQWYLFLGQKSLHQSVVWEIRSSVTSLGNIINDMNMSSVPQSTSLLKDIALLVFLMIMLVVGK